jgi:hypothetical protein
MVAKTYRKGIDMHEVSFAGSLPNQDYTVWDDEHTVELRYKGEVIASYSAHGCRREYVEQDALNHFNGLPKE